MRFSARLTLLLFLSLAQVASGKIITEPECHGFYAKAAQFFSSDKARKAEAFPFDTLALEAAIHPKLRLGGHRGLVNKGLWHYSEGGRRYFVKSLGSSSEATRQEIEHAKVIGGIGIGPKAYSFQDEVGDDYLIFDHVPGVNAKVFSNMRELQAPPEVGAEIRKSLGLPADTPWREVEKKYFAELYSRRQVAAKKLKEILKTLNDHEFYRLHDFQFMIHFEVGSPEVQIQVIDAAYFRRGKPLDEQDVFTAPLENWIGTFEHWQLENQAPDQSSVRDPHLLDVVEAHFFSAVDRQKFFFVGRENIRDLALAFH